MVANNDAGRLEAFTMDDGRAGLVVLLLGDPHLLEGGERGQDRSSDPYGVLALGGSNDFDLHGGGSEGSELLVHAISNAWEHGSTTRQDDVAVQILADIDVTLHDGIVSGGVNTIALFSNQRGLEQDLRASESLVSNSDDLPIRQLVVLLELRGLSSLLHLGVEVKGDVAQLLLDVSHDLTVGSRCELVLASLGQQLHGVVSQFIAS